MPKIQKPMFYDQVVPFCDDIIEGLKDGRAKTIGLSEAMRRADPVDFILKEKNLANAIAEIDVRKSELEKFKEAHNQSKCFWIDGMVGDSLLNVSHARQQNYAQTIRLPFPFMFFEFKEPIHLDLEELAGSSIDIRAITLTRLSDMARIGLKPKIIGGSLSDMVLEDEYEMFLHYKDKDDGYAYESILFNIHTLPSFTYLSQENFFLINPLSNKIQDLRDIAGFKSTRPFSSKIFHSNLPDGEAELNGEHTALSQMIDLTINLINYINAQNVYIQKVERMTDEQKRKLQKVNKKRAQEGRLLFMPTKPYYVIEVRKHVYLDDEEDKEGKSWELAYRVWVRGHNRHYKDENGRVRLIEWIEPHVRGPPDAPWKHNRYAVLYKRFGHLLHNSKYRKKD